MYNQGPGVSHFNILGDVVSNDAYQHNAGPRRSVYLENAEKIYTPNHPGATKVGPAPVLFTNVPGRPFDMDKSWVIYDTIKPMYNLLRVIGILPVTSVGEGVFKVTPKWIAYSLAIFLIVCGCIGYIKWDKVELVRSAEGRFEEAVIDYLFTVYLVPIIINVIVLYEGRKLAEVMTEWVTFEKYYNKVTKRKMPLYLGNKPLFITIVLPILSCATMIVTHISMVHFRFVQVVPYCYINTITYLIGGFWFIQCDVAGKIATHIADDFQEALRHVGPSSQVAHYRSLWMMLSKQIRDVGNASAYAVTFLCLYLFLIITLTIYGLFSQIQEGLGIKDIGLTITAVFAIGLLFFICDKAHYASNCVRVHFQKKLLLVELSWMNDDAQQEINMFLRATEMSPTDMSLGGFFDVNRNLFKSLLATMVTYLVVLLQFQISIPEDRSSYDTNSTAVLAPTASPK